MKRRRFLTAVTRATGASLLTARGGRVAARGVGDVAGPDADARASAGGVGDGGVASASPVGSRPAGAAVGRDPGIRTDPFAHAGSGDRRHRTVPNPPAPGLVRLSGALVEGHGRGGPDAGAAGASPRRPGQPDAEVGVHRGGARGGASRRAVAGDVRPGDPGRKEGSGTRVHPGGTRIGEGGARGVEPRRGILRDAAAASGKRTPAASPADFSSGNGPALPRYGPGLTAARPRCNWAARTGRDRVAAAAGSAAANMPQNK